MKSIDILVHIKSKNYLFFIENVVVCISNNFPWCKNMWGSTVATMKRVINTNQGPVDYALFSPCLLFSAIILSIILQIPPIIIKYAVNNPRHNNNCDKVCENRIILQGNVQKCSANWFSCLAHHSSLFTFSIIPSVAMLSNFVLALDRQLLSRKDRKYPKITKVTHN